MNLKPTFEYYFPEGSMGGECASFAEKLYAFGPVGNLYSQKYSYFLSHGSTNLTDIQVGDILLLNFNPNGHICIVNQDLGNAWQVTESNFHLDGIVHHTRIIMKGFSGITAHLRAPIKVKIINPMLTQKILVLYNLINMDPIIAGIQTYMNAVVARTNKQFTIEVDFAKTQAIFHTVTQNNPDGSLVTYANPDEIANEAKALMNEQYDIVCLIYEDNLVIGSPPNHPVENGQLEYGFNTISIPHSWLMAPSNQSGQEAFDFIANETTLFFAHECSHADYFLANSKGNAIQRDRTHDPNPYSTTPDTWQFFIDLLIELTPWWQYLAATAQGVLMLIYKFDDNPTEYILTDDATLIGITALGLPKVLGNRQQKLVILPANQRSNFTLSSAVIN